MKQISRLGSGTLLGILAASLFITLLTTFNPSVVSAAACDANPSSDAQATAQRQCVDKYIAKCKKDYNPAFCNNLSVEQINKCAADSAQPAFKEACIRPLESAYLKTAAAATGGSGSASLPDPTTSTDCKAANVRGLNENNCGIIKLITVVTNVLSGIVGVVIVAMLIVGGIQYSTAGPDPSKVQAARQKISNAILALILFIFGFALLQWLVPGGVF